MSSIPHRLKSLANECVLNVKAMLNSGIVTKINGLKYLGHFNPCYLYSVL